jgi:hypothetical protein
VSRAHTSAQDRHTHTYTQWIMKYAAKKRSNSVVEHHRHSYTPLGPRIGNRLPKVGFVVDFKVRHDLANRFDLLGRREADAGDVVHARGQLGRIGCRDTSETYTQIQGYAQKEMSHMR